MKILSKGGCAPLDPPAPAECAPFLVTIEGKLVGKLWPSSFNLFKEYHNIRKDLIESQKRESGLRTTMKKREGAIEVLGH